MADPSARRGMRGWTALAIVVGSFAGATLLETRAAWAFFLSHGVFLDVAHNDLTQGLASFAWSSALALLGTTVARFALWRRARARAADLAEDARVRRWAIAAPAILSFAWSVVTAPQFLADAWAWYLAMQGVQWVLEAIGVGFAMRIALGRLIAQRPEGELPQQTEAHEVVFSAVADTTATRVSIAVMLLLSLAMCVFVDGAKATDPRVFAAVLAYVTATLGAAAIFRRAARIRVGLDGVLVQGTGRKRFLPWSSIDDVQVDGVSIVVTYKKKNGARAHLRLQPHGDDAERKDALAERFRDAFVAAQAARHDTGHVHAAHAAEDGGEMLAGSMRGATDYRVAAVTREQLWGVVEGPAAAPSARALAAEALTHGLEKGDHARLRVAADLCADPEVKASLVRLLGAKEAVDDAAAEEVLGDAEAAIALPRRMTRE